LRRGPRIRRCSIGGRLSDLEFASTIGGSSCGECSPVSRP